MAASAGLLLASAGNVTHAQSTEPQEISSRDVEPTFKLQTERNLVMVRVVVRDAKGAVIDNLKQQDFQLFDRGKPQTILHFSIERPGKAMAPAQSPAGNEVEPEENGEETATLPGVPRRFVALYFDDVNTRMPEIMRAREAADHFLTSTVRPGDRVALFTSSGQKQVDFTERVGDVREALRLLQERPIVPPDSSCGVIPPYEAYLVVHEHDLVATQVATDEKLNCNPCTAGMSQEQCLSMAKAEVDAEAMQSMNFSETQSTAALRTIEALVRGMASLPGQRTLVVVSAGFLTETLRDELSQITNRALRYGVIINAIDARGLYDASVIDISQATVAVSRNARTPGQKTQILLESARRQTDGIRDLAVDTGGVFFSNSNDLEAGFRKTAGVPDAYYMLAFSPQNLKLDGTFHPIQVKMAALKGLSLQARRGYYAPRKAVDPAVQEKEELREAVFSQEETHELPIDVHTQFFMKSETEARIAVLTRLDLHPLHFRKDGDRNRDDLTFVIALFDRDGHMVGGQQRKLELRLRDTNLDRYMKSGISSRSTFDVKPGTYLVRAIVRDSESGEISGLNRTVEIPY